MINAHLASSINDQDSLQSLSQELPQQYELLATIGEGGMGSILKARNRFTGVPLAIKVLRAEAAQNRDSLQRFIFEAKAASLLRHPNICRVYDFDITENGLAYLAMDWVDGVDLENRVMHDGRLTAREAMHIFQPVASALAYAHQNRVIHRDIKPQNIMLSRDAFGRQEVQIVDFGIAKLLGEEENGIKSQGLTRAGFVVGTPLYMSPEQATGAKVDNRSDIYSLGCVMYFALTGRPPFVGNSAAETVTKHLTQPAPDIPGNLGVPADLKLIVLRAMEKKPEDRYPSMDLLATDLKKLTKGVTIQRRTLSRERQSAKNWIVSVGWAVVGFVVILALSWAGQNFLDPAGAGSKSAQLAKYQADVAQAHKKNRH